MMVAKMTTEFKWRPHQRDYSDLVGAIGAADGELRVGLEGPCGSGKSIGYLRAALQPGFPACNILSTTRGHLAQLEDTLKTHFPGGDWAILRGRSWYSCCGRPKGDDFDASDDARAAEWGDKKCAKGLECEYLISIQACAHAQVVVQCTIGFLYRRDAWRKLDTGDLRHGIVNREVAILDEAHEYPEVRRSYETSTTQVFEDEFKSILHDVNASRRTKNGYKRGYSLLSEGSPLAEDLYNLYSARYANVDVERVRGTSDATWNRKKDKIRKRYLKIITTLAGDPEKNVADVVYLKWTQGPKYGQDILHLVSEPLYAYVADKLAAREIYTSATLADVSAQLGITPEYLRVFPEIFDWENSVQIIAYADPTPNIGGNKPMDAETIRQLYGSDGRPLTLALFVSRRHVTDAAALIKDEENVWVQGVHGDLSDLVDRAKSIRSDEAPPFILAYSGWVGTDIPGRKWLILGSATLSPLGPVQDARQIRGCGGGWNDAHKVIRDRVKLKQGLGRALRTPEDRAVLIWTHTSVFATLGIDPLTGRMTT